MTAVPRALLFTGLGLYMAVTIWQLWTLDLDTRHLDQDLGLLVQKQKHAVRSNRVSASPRPRLDQPVVRVGVVHLNYAFLPYSVTVKVGTRVAWVNTTASPHTVTSVKLGLFSLTVPPRRGTSRVFGQVGSFQYYCLYHPYQHGVIRVIP